MRSRGILSFVGLVLICFPCRSAAQQERSTGTTAQEALTVSDREAALLERLLKVEARLAALEAKGATTAAEISSSSLPIPPVQSTQARLPANVIPGSADNPSLPGFLDGTTINGNLDGYYGYNFNRPVGRVNLLRANDVLSNSFTLNQADLIVERAPDSSAGRRLGLRVDLMFGQNTETLQGGAQNENRPQVYRNLFQAFGSYVVPLGSGLQVDFGKFASALGYENNYTKDQLNYSRSYYFNFLPFYHMGFRSTYKLSDKVALQYWLVNGANQTEDFNGFKSNGILLTVTPAKNVSWNLNYYFGQEGRDLVPDFNPGLPGLPTQPGLSTTLVSPRPNGREHIFDTYVNWNATSKLTLAAEADYVLNRSFRNSSPTRVIGGIGYIKYQLTPTFNFAGRFEYLDDRGGLFSGLTQALKDSTVTATYQPINGFQIRTEFRRDSSNQPFFLGSVPNRLERDQKTATLGMIWWFGGKQGSW